jgi:hypothetical protein
MRVDPETIAEAFNVNCPKKNWSARIVRTEYGGRLHEAVSFKDRSGLLTLVYDVDEGDCRKFSVIFNKAQASWGDYTNAIARGLHTVLSALQAGGLAFVAPVAVDAIIVRTQFGGIGGNVTVEVERREGDTGSDPMRELEPAYVRSEDWPYVKKTDGAELL